MCESSAVCYQQQFDKLKPVRVPYLRAATDPCTIMAQSVEQPLPAAAHGVITP
jgi:hypothetical protein